MSSEYETFTQAVAAEINENIAETLSNKLPPLEALQFLAKDMKFRRLCAQLLRFPEGLPANTLIKDMPDKINGLYKKVAKTICNTAQEFLNVENIPLEICSIIA